MRGGSEKSVRGLRGLWMETLARLVLSFQQTLWAQRRSGSLGFLSAPVQDILSVAVAANRHHQSHWLKNHLLPISPLLWRQLLELVSQICSSVCSASKDIYLHIQQHTHTKFFFHAAKTKKTPANLSLSCFLYPTLYVARYWMHSDRIHLMSFMFAGLIVFMWALWAHHSSSGRKLIRAIFEIYNKIPFLCDEKGEHCYVRRVVLSGLFGIGPLLYLQFNLSKKYITVCCCF